MPSRFSPQADNSLLRSQRNEVFTSITNGGLNPQDFEFKDYLHPNTSNLISTLTHKPTGYVFVFDTDQGNFLAIRTPGNERRCETQAFKNWNGLLSYFIEWVSILEREIKAPDLWEMLRTGAINLEKGPSTTEENSTFTPKEQKEITTRIIEIRTYIQTTYSPPENQLNNINRKLDILIDETKRQGREAWKYTAIGIIASVITTLSITPEQGQILWLYITGKLSEVISNVRSVLPK